MSFLLVGVALFFAGMGGYALAWPEHVVARFGTPSLTRDGRNEVRAVYGGFGLALAGLLLASVRAPAWAPGVWLAVAVALLGMAGGRLVSWALDGSDGPQPWLFFAVELALAGVLLVAFLGRPA